MNLEYIFNEYQKKLDKKYSKDEISIIFYSIAETILHKKSSILKIGKKESNPEIQSKKLLFDTYLIDLMQDKPYQYIIQRSYFYGLEFYVNSSVLIPRPETEELIEWIIKDSKNDLQKKSILDIGTGSGCIPIILKKNIPNYEIFALDFSNEALEIAKKNAKKHNQIIHFYELDFLNNSKWNELKKYNIIVSNPPYISDNEKVKISKNVLNFEPHSALFVPKENPLIFYEKIIEFSKIHLLENGKIYVEINQKYAQETYNLFKKNYKNVELRKDLSENYRMIKAY